MCVHLECHYDKLIHNLQMDNLVFITSIKYSEYDVEILQCYQSQVILIDAW